MNKATFLIRVAWFCILHPVSGFQLVNSLLIMGTWEPKAIETKIRSYLSHRKENQEPKFNPEDPNSLHNLLTDQQPYGKDFR